ncbi:hypothetical protein B1992_14150 [Pseudoxanthomonas broegbernensis]|uniref:DUF3108 domain-containing protein n=2 Tax=Pseudoxanthomonas broegbernensis TaxID=83619 RepID=A0A7V8GK73_9GAMM|nr:DUF3108 domain-containing protein [Pseudoxanthomonas broegbernensis]KAF1684876.1 hypothetical protein B1992_14150 [Pseudoxanthomonas broegbernensis]MBB6065270.1 hypothetical protein [Pseudoxanthomonas broegbernensis]
MAASEPAVQSPGEAPADAVLEPFLATYDAWYRGRQAGDASLQVSEAGDGRWRVDLSIRGARGLAGLARLNIEQSTVFEDDAGRYRPLSQSTVRKAMLLDKRVTGTYDWGTMQAHWDGDLKKDRRRPLALQPGDMSALLINLAVIRDARAGAVLHYRFVDGGRVREHVYHVAAQPETLAVADMSYDALRVARTDHDGDQTVLWVAGGVPTPIRILQRKDGRDEIDLRLVEYRGARG